ncbi:lysosome membrane protein 2-like [Bombus pyrosoma]|uniref:lysosome membrane protein 2-like n=1 Tax=Bombus pyrosoma TaxID=396416 RepID=UPI001CB8CC03|nr:lysosome membrane protein 2-like [Bombus pyrosoma]
MSPNIRQTDNFKEKDRSNFYKMWCYYGCAIIWIIFGLYVSHTEVFLNKLISKITEALPLREGSEIYKVWTSPIHLTFTCHFFNVTNPDEVMSGSNPYFNEVGPFTYDEILEKQIIDVDDTMDEITYTTKSTYSFNKDLSVKLSKHDKVTILNPAYIGTISMASIIAHEDESSITRFLEIFSFNFKNNFLLSGLPPEFMEKYGNNIPKLFPNRSTIFLKANPNDLLFNGIKVSCNLRKFPELDLICKTLGSNPPLVLRETDKQDVYLLSIFQRVQIVCNKKTCSIFFFQHSLLPNLDSNVNERRNYSDIFVTANKMFHVSKVNSTFRGPFSVNRGVNDITRLGDITSYMGKRIQTMWNSEDCNTVRGTDSIIWAPLIKPLPFVSTFIPDLCRTIEADYKDEVSKYLPLIRDLILLQKLPVILSEPHFLHGDPQLLKYARGLNPDERLHETYIIIEPYTGTPLSGQKRTQINLYLEKQPVELLSNVSEGYFPLMWCENVRSFKTVPIILSCLLNI